MADVWWVFVYRLSIWTIPRCYYLVQAYIAVSTRWRLLPKRISCFCNCSTRSCFTVKKSEYAFLVLAFGTQIKKLDRTNARWCKRYTALMLAVRTALTRPSNEPLNARLGFSCLDAPWLRTFYSTIPLTLIANVRQQFLKIFDRLSTMLTSCSFSKFSLMKSHWILVQLHLLVSPKWPLQRSRSSVGNALPKPSYCVVHHWL